MLTIPDFKRQVGRGKGLKGGKGFKRQKGWKGLRRQIEALPYIQKSKRYHYYNT
jgi:hypothetical protein